MLTKTEICNVALAHIGHTDSIADVETERSKAAVMCRRFYPLAVRNAISDFPWSFARKVVNLALLDGETSDKYDYVYAMPNDCLEPREIIIPNVPVGDYFTYYNSFFYGYARGPFQTSLPDEYREVFEKGVSSDGVTRTIMTNMEEARLLYTADAQNTSLFTSAFTDAVAYRLASYLAMPLAQSQTMQNSYGQAYSLVISQAGAQDLRGENAPNEPLPDSVTSRLY